jgi:hypothetical protein
MNDRIPKKLQARFEEITSLTDSICQKHLNEEYAEMSRKMAAALARKRPSPLAGGRANSWACGIVYTIGFVNFLFDKSFPPYMSAEELCTAFGVSKNTGYNKSKEIRDLFDLMQYDPRWTLPSLMDKNPMAWMIMVNGLIVDVRHAPRQIQEEAFRKGLIPYLPNRGESPPTQPGETTLPFKVGDSVVVKRGVQDPDFGGDLGGWQGRVTEIDTRPPDPPLIAILWDSITLRNIPHVTIARAEKEGLDWSTIFLYASEVELAASRDTLEDVDLTLTEIASQVAWLHLGEEGERIQKVLDKVDPDDEDACLETWFKNLEKTLTFPFEAKLIESESYGPIRQGDSVRVIGLNGVFEDYGILVDAKKDRTTYQLPLADLEVKDKHAPQYQRVKDYAVWFANRS